MSTAFLVFAALLLGTGAMRLGELVVSVRRMRQRPDAVVSEPALFPLMAALHTGLVIAPLAEVWFLQRPFVPIAAAISVALLLAATVLRVWTLSTIGIAWNVRVVAPEDDTVVTSGPYAWIRHPNYVAVILEIVALPLFHGAWLSAIGLTALNALVLFFRIRTEEAVLLQVPAWREAMADRPRFIPGVF
jgi:methyltransferase